ncbi:MAG: helix-turn-helix transcriptional regulator [Desulfosporosinus sp.]|nr:helix-turn-helix transcriptional regulator [Desulfosporosinus sp.]
MKTLIDETICKRIVYYRNKCQLTQIELAANVGIRFNHLVDIEAGLKIPRMNELEKLATGLNITITELVRRC